MMKTKIFLIVSACISLHGCATPSPAEFRPGNNRQQFAKDSYECERDARQIRGNDCEQMDMFEKCMRSKGYEEIQGSANKGLCR